MKFKIYYDTCETLHNMTKMKVEQIEDWTKFKL